MPQVDGLANVPKPSGAGSNPAGARRHSCKGLLSCQFAGVSVGARLELWALRVKADARILIPARRQHLAILCPRKRETLRPAADVAVPRGAMRQWLELREPERARERASSG
jgi:hypothetical protein